MVLMEKTTRFGGFFYGRVVECTAGAEAGVTENSRVICQ